MLGVGEDKPDLHHMQFVYMQQRTHAYMYYTCRIDTVHLMCMCMIYVVYILYIYIIIILLI